MPRSFSKSHFTKNTSYCSCYSIVETEIFKGHQTIPVLLTFLLRLPPPILPPPHQLPAIHLHPDTISVYCFRVSFAKFNVGYTIKTLPIQFMLCNCQAYSANQLKEHSQLGVSVTTYKVQVQFGVRELVPLSLVLKSTIYDKTKINFIVVTYKQLYSA